MNNLTKNIIDVDIKEEWTNNPSMDDNASDELNLESMAINVNSLGANI